MGIDSGVDKISPFDLNEESTIHRIGKTEMSTTKSKIEYIKIFFFIKCPHQYNASFILNFLLITNKTTTPSKSIITPTALAKPYR